MHLFCASLLLRHSHTRKGDCVLSTSHRNSAYEPLAKFSYPSNSLWFLGCNPMPCEYRTAKIVQETLIALDEKDTRAIAYRYLQVRQGMQKTRFEIFLSGILCLLNLTTTYFQLPLADNEKKWQPLLRMVSFCTALVFAINIVPNVCNSIRYQKTMRSCEDWLRESLGQKGMQSIKKEPYNHKGFTALDAFFAIRKIPQASQKNTPSSYNLYRAELR